MSAPSEGAAGPQQCACTNISLMQLFHELKQKFPGVPDHVVTSTIATYCHDKSACEVRLHSEVKASLTHAYHAPSSAAAKQLSDQKLSEVPHKCRNQSIVQHDFPKANAIKPTPCAVPQTASLSAVSYDDVGDKGADPERGPSAGSDEDSHRENLIKTSETKEVEPVSPVTINIDNCTSRYCPDSTPSDAESVDVIAQIRDNGRKQDDTKIESQNYKILKSSKVKSNLNERLEVSRLKPSPGSPTEKKVIEKAPAEKPKRPCTLEFLKPNPDFTNFGQTKVASEPPAASSNALPESKPISTEGESIKGANAEDTKRLSNTGPSGLTQWQDAYPLNLSVNVNCHMDLVPNANRPPRSYSNEGWSDDYSSPRAYTSVNLTVRTPTSNMQSPIRESPAYTSSPGEARGFEGHVTVTVSPSTSRPRPLRRAPPVPHQESRAIHTPDVEPSTPTDSLVNRQRARLGRLARELMVERARLSQLARETAILAEPPPSAGSTRRLRAVVQGLRARCQNMTRQLDREMTGNEPLNNEFYSNIYTGQRHQPAPGTPGVPRSSPPQQINDEAPSWKCHVCTFENHGLLNKCETCDMPRILVGTDALVNTVDSGIGTLRLSGSSFGSRSVDSGLGSRIVGDAGPVSNANSRILPV